MMRRTLLGRSTAAISAMFVPGASAQGSSEALGEAWSAWAQGEFARGRMLAAERASVGDEARHIQVITAAAIGDHAGALTIYADVSSGYRRLAEMDEAILWAHVWSGDITGAQTFALRRRLLRNASTRERLRIAVAHPFSAETNGVIELPFTQGFSQYMPGVAARVNGLSTVARLDTGGAFVHMTRAQARSFGVTFAGCQRDFAALANAPICHGRANLELGKARLSNVPVAVHVDEAFAAPIAAAADLGDTYGVVIGTNVFRQFLTTVDAPNHRLLLSDRSDPSARALHFAKLSPVAGETSFGIIGDHYIIARGKLGTSEVPLFVDSGLAAFNLEQGQAALLASQSTLSRWGLWPALETGRFAEVPTPVGLGPVEATGLTAMPVPDRMWREGFGEWGGVQVEALISHGYLKRWAWTIDFDRQQLMFHFNQS